jgi:hypothetical protein
MTLLADFVLILHFAVALFIIAGMLCTWIGARLGWHWVRNFWFRAAHLSAIIFVAAQTLLGGICPLTVLEDGLRGHASTNGFIERWVGRWLYYDFPPWVFAASYIGCAALAALTWRWVPPQARNIGTRTGD